MEIVRNIPRWVWFVIALLVIVGGVFLYKKNKSGIIEEEQSIKPEPLNSKPDLFEMLEWQIVK